MTIANTPTKKITQRVPELNKRPDCLGEARRASHQPEIIVSESIMF